MGRRNNASTSNYAKTNGTPITGVGFTMNCWLYLRDGTDYGTESCLMSVEAAVNPFNDGQYTTLLYDGANGEGQGAHKVIFDTSGGPTFQAVSTTAVSNAAGWIMATGTYTSTGSGGAAVYLNAGSKGTTAAGTLKTPSGWDNLCLGALRSSTTTFSPLSGVIAECGLWNTTLSQGEITQLYQGVSTWRVRPDNLIGYWLPAWDAGVWSIQDWNPVRLRKWDATITGSMDLDVGPPRVYYPAEPKRRYWRVGSAGGGPTRTALNTRSNPLGVEIGMGWRMPT